MVGTSLKSFNSVENFRLDPDLNSDGVSSNWDKFKRIPYSKDRDNAVKHLSYAIKHWFEVFEAHSENIKTHSKITYLNYCKCKTA